MYRRELTLAVLLVAVSGELPRAWSGMGAADLRGDSLVESNTAFALDLYARLRSNEGNLFVSPYSISSALAMTYAGAKAETERQMAKVLHFSGQERLHADFAALTASLNSATTDPRCNLCAANAVWGQKGLRYQDSFHRLIEKHYGAEFKEVDFAAAAQKAADTINGWVKSQTQQKISELLQPSDVSSAVELVLTSAVYFRGDWAARFDPTKTVDAAFHLNETKQVTVPMMKQTSRLPYFAAGRVEIVSLPYFGDRVSMIVLLPMDVDGLAALEQTLDPSTLNRWLSQLQPQLLEISLPRFNLSSRFDLAHTLAGMGMPDAFDAAKADFSGITERPGLFIFKVLHETRLEVNEKGSEASAATAVTMGKGGNRPPLFTADHPFMFLVRDDQTRTILFIGRVTNPI